MVSLDDWGLQKNKQKARKIISNVSSAITLACMLSKAIQNVIPNKNAARIWLFSAHFSTELQARLNRV
jgi:hypothetical protein